MEKIETHRTSRRLRTDSTIIMHVVEEGPAWAFRLRKWYRKIEGQIVEQHYCPQHRVLHGAAIPLARLGDVVLLPLLYALYHRFIKEVRLEPCPETCRFRRRG